MYDDQPGLPRAGEDDRAVEPVAHRWLPFLIGVALAVGVGSSVRTMSALADVTADPEEVSTPVVRVVAHACTEQRIGAGVPVSPRLVVTARHLVQGSSTVEVVVDGATHVGHVRSIDPLGRDVAVVQLDRPLPGDSARLGWRPDDEEPVLAFGFPFGGEETEVAGSLVGIGRAGAYQQPGDDLLVTSEPFVAGMSGGPLTDANGWVLGVVIGQEEASGSGLAVPVWELDDLLDNGAPAPSAPC